MANARDKNGEKKAEGGKPKNGKRREERREFFKKVGAIGAFAVAGASTNVDKAEAQRARSGSPDLVPPGAVVGIDPQSGVVTLNHEAIRIVAGNLRDRIKNDECLRVRFNQNPREVLGSVGINSESQREILRADADFQGSGSPFFRPGGEAWCITTQCCCTSCCLTCWFTNFSL